MLTSHQHLINICCISTDIDDSFTIILDTFCNIYCLIIFKMSDSMAFRDALANNNDDDAHCSISSSSSSGGDTNMSFNFSIPNHLPISRLCNPHPPSTLLHNNMPDPPTYTQQIAEPKNPPSITSPTNHKTPKVQKDTNTCS
jgi:hypothetical protein